MGERQRLLEVAGEAAEPASNLKADGVLIDGVAEAAAPRRKVYTRRFYVLFLLSMVSLLQCMQWMTYSSVPREVRQLYGPRWTGAQLDLLAAWGPLVYIPAVLIAPKIERRLGLRACVTLASGFIAACSVLRSIAVKDPLALYLAHAAQWLNALGGPFVLATPSRLSTLWFPPEERTTATTAAIMANYLGGGLGYLVSLPVTTASGLRFLLWGEAGVALLLCFLCCVDHLWPSVPPTAPSASAEVVTDATSIISALKLLRRPQLLVICLTYGAAQGIYSGWFGVLGPILDPLGFSKPEISWLGFVMALACPVGALIAARFDDKFQAGSGRQYRMLVLLYGVAVLAFGAFTFVANGIFPMESSIVRLLFVAGVGILGSMVLNASSGLFYEAAVETLFPVSEVTANALLTLAFNVFSGGYELVGSITHGSSGAAQSGLSMNWIMCGVVFFCTVLLAVGFHEQNERTKLDVADTA